MATKAANRHLILEQVNLQADHIMAAQYKVKPEILFLHYLSGTQKNPYLLRRSVVRVSQASGLNKIASSVQANEEYKTIDRQELHNVVLSDYIKYLDRDHTLLSFALNLLMEGDINKDLYLGSFKIDRTSDKARLFSVRSRDSAECKGVYHFFHRAMTGRAGATLVHQECTDAFFKWLYAEASRRLCWQKTGLRHLGDCESSVPEEDWKRNFELSRSDLYGRWMAEREGNDECNHGSWQRELQERQRLWNELAALQSALLYFKAGSTALNGYSCSVVIRVDQAQQPKQGDVGGQPTAVAVAIISPAIASKEAITNVGPHLESLLGSARQREADGSGSYDGIVTAIEETSASKGGSFEKDKFEKGLASFFTVPPAFADQINLYASWILLLAKQLDGRVHEGKALSFCLVCGERSEIEDHKNTRLRCFKPNVNGDIHRLEDLARLAVPCIPANMANKDKPNFILEKASHAAQLLSHEHYPWFERGRHALLWDVTSKSSREPIGVVSLCNANWGQIIDDRLRGHTSTDLPNCTITYVSAEQKCVGIVVAQSRTGNLKEIYRWRNGKWQFVEEEQRRSHLEEWLKSALGSEDSEMISRTSSVVLRVADDPNKGGTLLFVSKEKKVLLKEMGTPWSLNDRLDEDDLVALIGHDGATVRRVKQEEWQHRRLLTPAPEQATELDQLERKVRNGNPPGVWPLECKGSRRWSAAMMALHPDVRAVVVISQDGDIHCWTVRREQQGKQAVRRVFMTELTSRGDMNILIEHTLP